MNVDTRIDPVFVISNDGNIECCNAEALNLLNIAKEDLIGKNLKTIMGDFDLTLVESEVMTLSSNRYKKDNDKPIGVEGHTAVVIKSADGDEVRSNLCLIQSNIYYNIVDSFPDAVIIIQDGKIVLSNKAAKLFEETIDGESISQYLGDVYQKASKRIENIIKEKTTGKSRDYEIHLSNGSTLYLEMVSSYIEYNNKPAVMTIARDVTVKRYDLNNAARMQKLVMMKKLPEFNDVLMKTVYLPAKTVSGDFYFVEKLSDNLLIGILGDVRGKGVTAAMHISALEILFKELVQSDNELNNLTRKLNQKVNEYFRDYYVAAILFSIDLENKKIILCGAGINEYITVDENLNIKEEIIKGPFLGMFDHLEFDVVTYDLESLRRLVLFTDGLENLMNEAYIDTDLLCNSSIFEFANKVNYDLDEKSVTLEGLIDDSTLIAFDLGFKGTVHEYKLDGLNNYQKRVDEILRDINMPDIEFNIHLILMELLTNAFKYGNKNNSELPIKVRIVIDRKALILEVTDMGLAPKNFVIKTEIMDDDVLSESGRGIFLVEQLSDKLYVEGSSIIAEIFTDERSKRC